MVDQILDEIVRRLVSAVHPEAVFLFGSRARGDATEVSDYHLITCALQRAVLQRAFPGQWQRMINPHKGDPILQRTWRLIAEREAQINWSTPLESLAVLA